LGRARSLTGLQEMDASSVHGQVSLERHEDDEREETPIEGAPVGQKGETRQLRLACSALRYAL
jgi:hypothetical protein